MKQLPLRFPLEIEEVQNGFIVTCKYEDGSQPVFVFRKIGEVCDAIRFSTICGEPFACKDESLADVAPHQDRYRESDQC